MLTRHGALPSSVLCSFSPFIFCIHSSLFSNWRCTVLFEIFNSWVSLVSTEELVLHRHARCVLSRPHCDGHSLLLHSYLSRIGKIEKILQGAPVITRPRTLLIPFCTVQLWTLCAARSLVTLCILTSSPGPGKLLGFWSSLVFRQGPIPRKVSGSTNNNKEFDLQLVRSL